MSASYEQTIYKPNYYAYIYEGVVKNAFFAIFLEARREMFGCRYVNVWVTTSVARYAS